MTDQTSPLEEAPANPNTAEVTPPAEETKSLSLSEWNNLQAKMRKETEARKTLEAKAAEYEKQLKDAELSKLKKEDADKYAAELQKQADEKLSLAEQRLAEAEKTAQRSALKAAAAAQNVADLDLTMMALEQMLNSDQTIITDYNDPSQIEAAVTKLLEAKPLLKKPVAQTVPPAGAAPAANGAKIGFDDLNNMSKDQLANYFATIKK